MPAEPALSHTAGETDAPLSSRPSATTSTRRSRGSRDREALVDVEQGTRWTYAELKRRRGPSRARGFVAAGHREGRPGRHLGAELRRVDHRPVRHGQDGRDPRQHQPRLPHARAEVRPRPGRDPDDRGRAVVQDQRLRRDDRRGPRRRAPDSSRSSSSARTAGDDLLAGADEVSPEHLAQIQAGLANTDGPINIQYTSGTTGFPKGATLSHRNILNNGFFVGELCRYTEADRVCIPVPFYHCFGMVMGNLACTTHGAAMVIPAPGFDPATTLAGAAGRAGHLALRRADDVHRRVVAAELRRLRPVHRAHRDHGRLPVPGRADEEAHRGGHRGDDDLLRHDRDVTGVDADPHRRLLRAQGRHRRPRSGPHLEIKVVDPLTGETLPRGRAGRVLHQGLLGDARLLGAAGQDRRGPRRTAGCTPATSPSWTRTATSQITGRIKDMVIRGGENVYPREIEEFLYTHPDILDAQVIGVPDEQVRRGAVRLDPDAGRRRAAHRRVAARVRHRQARPLQDPALRRRSSTSSR